MRHHYLFCKAPFRAVAEWHTYVTEILPFHFAPREMQSRVTLSAQWQHVLPAFPCNRGQSSPGFGLHRVLWEASCCSTPDNHLPTERILMAISGTLRNKVISPPAKSAVCRFPCWFGNIHRVLAALQCTQCSSSTHSWSLTCPIAYVNIPPIFIPYRQPHSQRQGNSLGQRE